MRLAVLQDRLAYAEYKRSNASDISEANEWVDEYNRIAGKIIERCMVVFAQTLGGFR